MDFNTSSLVLITGASGYIGSFVVHYARKAGYPCRLVARDGKVDGLRAFYAKDEGINIVAINNVATGDFSDILKGVDAVIHVASPLPGRQDSAGMLKSAVEGTLNVIRQATVAGVKKFVVTSTLAVLKNSAADFYTGDIITPNDWNDATPEKVLDGSHDSDALWIYTAVKTIAERKLWEFANQHPEIEVATILPPMVYGPILPDTKIENKAALVSYSMLGVTIYTRLFPEEGSATKLKRVQDEFPLTVDVRDVAKAHVLALKAPPTSKVGHKRFIVAGEAFHWKDAVEHMLDVRPGLRARLPNPSEATKVTVCSLDLTRTKEVLGLDEYVDWRDTVVDNVDSIVDVEKSWNGA